MVKGDNMFGKLPAPARHLLLLILAASLTGLLKALPSLEIPDNLVPFVTGFIAVILAWVTPLVQAYGLGVVPEIADATSLDDLVQTTDNSSQPEDGPQRISQDPDVVIESTSETEVV